ncbi:hypothetical protein GGF32_001351 [Allomyces javanicus]|nr:hypothetical protein GGF32_001351 [Allomyces javanicus]
MATRGVTARGRDPLCPDHLGVWLTLGLVQQTLYVPPDTLITAPDRAGVLDSSADDGRRDDTPTQKLTAEDDVESVAHALPLVADAHVHGHDAPIRDPAEMVPIAHKFYMPARHTALLDETRSMIKSKYGVDDNMQEETLTEVASFHLGAFCNRAVDPGIMAAYLRAAGGSGFLGIERQHRVWVQVDPVGAVHVFGRAEKTTDVQHACCDVASEIGTILGTMVVAIADMDRSCFGNKRVVAALEIARDGLRADVADAPLCAVPVPAAGDAAGPGQLAVLVFSTMFKKRDKMGIMRNTSYLMTAWSFLVRFVYGLEVLARRILRLVTARVTISRRLVLRVEDLIDAGIESEAAVLPAARGALFSKTTIMFADVMATETERSRSTSPSSWHAHPMPPIPPNLARAATDPWIATTTSTRAHSPLSARCNRDPNHHAEAMTDVMIHGHPHEVASIERRVRALLADHDDDRGDNCAVQETPQFANHSDNDAS